MVYHIKDHIMSPNTELKTNIKICRSSHSSTFFKTPTHLSTVLEWTKKRYLTVMRLLSHLRIMPKSLRGFSMFWRNMVIHYTRSILLIIYYTRLYHQINSLVQNSTYVGHHTRTHLSNNPLTSIQWLEDSTHMPTLH